MSTRAAALRALVAADTYPVLGNEDSAVARRMTNEGMAQLEKAAADPADGHGQGQSGTEAGLSSTEAAKQLGWGGPPSTGK